MYFKNSKNVCLIIISQIVSLKLSSYNCIGL